VQCGCPPGPGSGGPEVGRGSYPAGRPGGRSFRLAELSAPGPWLCRSRWAAGGPCSAGACLGLAAVGPGGPGNLASKTAVWAVIRVGHGIRSWAGLSHRAAGWIVPRPPLPGPGGAGPVVGMESRAATGDLGSQSPCGACLHRVAGCRPVGSAEDLGAVRCCPVLPGRKFQSHPGVPPGRLIVHL
jgi:hypothetical protein